MSSAHEFQTGIRLVHGLEVFSSGCYNGVLGHLQSRSLEFLQEEKIAMKTILMFPGQGSQSPGMGDTLFPRYPEKLKIARSILGYSISDLCLHEESKLHQTLYTQPALFVVNALSYEDRRGEFQSDYHLGHSLGEYNALHASGCFDFETGLRLVKKRAELMSQTQGGKMAAIIGLSERKIRDVLSGEGNTVDIANYNSPTQYIISGEKASIEKMMDKLKMAGAKRVILLQVSGAFHSRYMRPIEGEYRLFLDGFQFDPPSIPVIAKCHSLYVHPG